VIVVRKQNIGNTIAGNIAAGDVGYGSSIVNGKRFDAVKLCQAVVVDDGGINGIWIACYCYSVNIYK
jgi:hypothetical protein